MEAGYGPDSPHQSSAGRPQARGDLDQERFSWSLLNVVGRALACKGDTSHAIIVVLLDD